MAFLLSLFLVFLHHVLLHTFSHRFNRPGMSVFRSIRLPVRPCQNGTARIHSIKQKSKPEKKSPIAIGNCNGCFFWVLSSFGRTSLHSWNFFSNVLDVAVKLGGTKQIKQKNSFTKLARMQTKITPNSQQG